MGEPMPDTFEVDQDKHLTCQWKENGQECGNEFVFSKNDQAFYADKGYSQPKYCKPHRAARKQRFEDKQTQQN